MGKIGCEGECPECQLKGSGLAGYVGKVASYGKYDDSINKLAGQIWIRRGGKTSSGSEQTNDYQEAVKMFTRQVCDNVRKKR